MNTEPTSDPFRLKRTRDRLHSNCVVCNPANPSGLGIDFILQSDNCVMGEFTGSTVFEGYPGLLHGGITAALLDGAMTNCLFAFGIEALTAELKVRYRKPVDFYNTATVRAKLVESHGRLYVLRADLQQNGQIKVTACGKFIEKSNSQDSTVVK